MCEDGFLSRFSASISCDHPGPGRNDRADWQFAGLFGLTGLGNGKLHKALISVHALRNLYKCRSLLLTLPIMASCCLVAAMRALRGPSLPFDNHGALTIWLHAGGRPASVSGGFGLDGGGCSVDFLNQKSSS
jgi:hypothetical protein